MFESLAIARKLTDAGIDRAQADAIADGIRSAGEHVTPEHLDARIAEVNARIADVLTAVSAVETRLTWRMLGIAGLVIAAQRLLG